MRSPLQRLAKMARALRPTWRQGCLMLATFVLVSALSLSFLLVAKARDDSALVSSWFDMFERCRASVETREPLSMLNLLPSNAAVDPIRIAGAVRARMW